MSRQMSRSYFPTVLIGLAQGAALLAIYHWWPGPEDRISVGVFQALTVAVVGGGLGWQLCDVARHRRIVAGALTVLILSCALMTWSVSGLSSIPSSSPSWFFSLCAIWYIGITMIASCGEEGGRGPAESWLPYPSLFQNAWRHAFVIALALLVTGIFWALLALCARLFASVGIGIFDHLFKASFFVFLSLSVVAALGVRLGREKAVVIGQLRSIVVSVCRGLLPLASAIAVGFTLTILVMGPSVLWQTGKATPILLTLTCALLFLLNGVYQDGAQPAPYSTLARRLVEVSLVASAVLCGVAGVSIYMRISQYGLSPQRFDAAFWVGVTTVYALCAAWAVFARGAEWLPSLKRSNVINAALLCVALCLIHTPWLNAWQASANDHFKRVMAQTAYNDDASLYFLSHSSGTAGVQAYIRIEEAAKGDAIAEPRRSALRAAIKRVEQMEYAPSPTGPARVVEKAYRLRWVGPELAPVEQFDPKDLDQARCGFEVCVVLPVDLDGDGKPELLVASAATSYRDVDLYALNAAGRYSRVGVMTADDFSVSGAKSLFEALGSGEARVVTPKYRSLQLGDMLLAPRLDRGLCTDCGQP